MTTRDESCELGAKRRPMSLYVAACKVIYTKQHFTEFSVK